jgi:hypothetical protein
LLDGAGHTLKPKVRCVMQLKNLGAGNPDGGLFTADQFDRQTGEAKDLGQPSRGVIEVKAPVEPVDDTATTGQITKYWDRYKLVLVTNLRDWLLLGEREGQRVTLERFSLAPTEAAFWALAEHPAKAQTEQGEAFSDFLARVLLHNAPLADPKDLAALLASYAREARHRVEHTTDVAAKQLEALQQSLESSLGVTFSANEGGHFFRSTLVQTLFYGVFSAWVLRRENAAPGQTLGPFDWKSAAHSLNVPMIAALFGQLSQPAKLKALNLTEVLDWAADALNRVDQAAFFKTFESTRSIQYFYEPFLAAFDPQLRKSLGVWYTPEETAVALMVRNSNAASTGTVLYRDWWGTSKRSDLLASLDEVARDTQSSLATPSQINRLRFQSSQISTHYSSWPAVADFSSNAPQNGPIERRGNTLVVMKSATATLDRLKDYLNPLVSNADVAALEPIWMQNAGEFKAEKSRKQILSRKAQYNAASTVSYPFKPFDVQSAYLDNLIAPLFSRPAPELLAASKTPGIRFFITRDTADKDVEGPPFLMSNLVCDYDCISGHARHFPTVLGTASKVRQQEIETNWLGSQQTAALICVVPVRMTEAWLVANEKPIRSAVGNPNGTESLGLPPVKDIESLPDPKEILFAALKAASGLNASRKRRFNPHQFRHRVRELTDDLEPLRKLSSFKHLEAQVQRLLVKSNS